MKAGQALELAALVVGLALIGVGAWMWFPPAGLIAPGAILVAAVLIPNRKEGA